MIRINCPFCGTRDHSEFTYGGDGSIDYPALDAPKEDWHDAVFLRDNICGVQLETWHHVHGCRMWLKIERDTLTHEIHSVRPAHPGLAAALGTEHGVGK
ncbi:sarcosine oxidase subunit delta [Roseibium sp. Sym1]|uniref:sarcosine oxidase subunit delta n=1 Tax=Roseibium sp. Sym1 TaxID=3016006 RepID=UPI0022B50A53|nr:sarcosine oxidase subunit delta [Roseibium sp. Sym1]